MGRGFERWHFAGVGRVADQLGECRGERARGSPRVRQEITAGNERFGRGGERAEGDWTYTELDTDEFMFRPYFRRFLTALAGGSKACT